MCGISAIYKYTKVTAEDERKLSQMNKEMVYRGPDDNGIWHDDTCGLAHTRLSIIGLDNGHQPLFNEDKSLVLICNGEIYNYKELGLRIKEKGHTLSTHSDCEVILHLYEEYGVECLQHLRGMFAFCLYDSKRKQLFAARDRVGEKTLYYAQVPCGVVFSTELKAILKNYIDKPQLNAKNLAESIRYGYPIELKHTYIEQINRLQAGEYAIVDNKGLELHTYWDRYNLPKFTGTRENAKAEILRLMHESVTQCLQSDVPVAVLLSGGIDSSTIAAMARETGREIHCITAGYKGAYGCDERPVAKQFAQEQGLIYHEVELDANDFKDLYRENIEYLDEPVADIASIAQWALYKKAKELGFTVLLGGLGGDELFYGYPYYNALAESYRLRREHLSLFPLRGRKWMPLCWLAKNWRYVISAGYLQGGKLDDKQPVWWNADDYDKFMSGATLQTQDGVISLQNIDVHMNFGDVATLDTLYDYQFSRFMTTQCLYLADRLGMGNSMEVRSPFVDYKLVEFVSSLPTEMKFNGIAKGFYKECLSGIVPDSILYASKRGFTPPFNFIQEICKEYSYSRFKGDYVYFNSMLADHLLSNLGLV